MDRKGWGHIGKIWLEMEVHWENMGKHEGTWGHMT